MASMHDRNDIFEDTDASCPNENENDNNIDKIFESLKYSTPKHSRPQQRTQSQEKYSPIMRIDDSEESAIMQEKHNYKLISKYLQIINSSQNRQERDQTRQELKTFAHTWRLKYITDQAHYPLSREEKHIIRMDFYGSINRPETAPHRSNLSSLYLKFLNTAVYEPLPPQNYDLAASPTWLLFRQFPRFRKIEAKLKVQMQRMNIPQEMLPQLNAYDFSDILYKYFRKGKSPNKAYLFLGTRQSFIKDFIRHNEAGFRKYLQLINVDERYADVLIDKMKRTGCTSDIWVVSPNKWKFLFKKYQLKGLIAKDAVFSPDNYEQYMELIKSQHDYPQIAVLGNDGKPLSGPEFSVHHKTAVKDAANIPDLADVNKFENLCLTIDYPYHRFLHSLDITQTIDKRETYKSRIYMDKNIIFWGGFHPKFHIYYDYRNDPRTLRQKRNNTLWKEKNHMPTQHEIRTNYLQARQKEIMDQKEKEKQEKEKKKNTQPTAEPNKKIKQTQKSGIGTLPAYVRIFAERGEKGLQAQKKAQKIASIIDSLYFCAQNNTRKEIPEYIRKFDGKYKDRKKKASALSNLLGVMQAVAGIEDKTAESKERIVKAAETYDLKQQKKQTRILLYQKAQEQKPKAETQTSKDAKTKKKKTVSYEEKVKKKVIENLVSSITPSISTITQVFQAQPNKIELMSPTNKPKKQKPDAPLTPKAASHPQTTPNAPVSMDKRVKTATPALNKTLLSKEDTHKTAPHMDKIIEKLKQKKKRQEIEQYKRRYKNKISASKIAAIKELYRTMQKVAALPTRTPEQNARATTRIMEVLSHRSQNR